MPSTGSTDSREKRFLALRRGASKSSREPKREEPESPPPPLLCPSFSPRQPGKGVVFGVMAGTPEQPKMIPLENPEPVTEEIFQLTAPLHPSEVFRIASPCVEGGCKNFSEGICHLAKLATQKSAVLEELPPCRIRSECVWWHQEGGEACLRCPQVVTNTLVTLSYRNKR